MSDKDYFDLMQQAHHCRELLHEGLPAGPCPQQRKIVVSDNYCKFVVQEYVKEYNARHTLKITVESYMEADT